MNFRMQHQNFNVFDLEKSIRFYEEALGLRVVRHMKDENGKWEICFMANDMADFQLELTWSSDYDRPYDLGDGEFHLAFRTDDFAAAHAHHEKMGCIVFENPNMGPGLYFITDPDGYWLEILPNHD